MGAPPPPHGTAGVCRCREAPRSTGKRRQAGARTSWHPNCDGGPRLGNLAERITRGKAMRTKFTKGARCSLFQAAARPLGRLIAVMSSAIAVGCGADAGTQGAELGSTSQAATLQPVAPPAPPELKLKLNDDLAALTEVILPAVARSEGLDRIEPEDQQLFRMAKREMKNETSAGVDVLLDTAFGCHNHHPLTIELRDLVVELSIDEHTAELDVTQDGLDVDLDLDDLVITGPSGPGYGDDTPTDDDPRIDFEPHDPRFGGAGDVGDGPDLGDTGLGSGPGQVQTGAL